MPQGKGAMAPARNRQTGSDVGVDRPQFVFEHFTAIPNDWVRDPKLTLADKGLLTYLMSHAPGYPLTVEQIVAQTRDGRAAVAGAMKRLEAAGYLRRHRQRDEKGRLGRYRWRMLDPREPEQEIDSGPDQQERDVSAGGDQFIQTTAGSTSVVEPATKKTTSKKPTEEDHFFDAADDAPRFQRAPFVPEQRDPDREQRQAERKEASRDEATDTICEALRSLGGHYEEFDTFSASVLCDYLTERYKLGNPAEYVKDVQAEELKRHYGKAVKWWHAQREAA